MPAIPLEPKKIRRLGLFGVIRQAEVDDINLPDESLTEAVNVHFDRKGAITLRPGMATIGATISAGYPIWGLHNTQSGSMIAVISQAGSAKVYTFGGTSWAENLQGGTANTTKRFVNFANRVIAINWGSSASMYGSMQVWAGVTNAAAWTTTGSPINPQGLTDDVNPSPQPQFGEVFKSRMYLAGGDTDGSDLRKSRLWFSSVISSTGVITWTPTTDFVDINPNDGENITALKRFSLELLVFKPNYIYRFRTSGVDPDPMVKVGTRSQESIIEGKKGIYFHHESGFYNYSGGYPQEISRPISDIIDAIPLSYMDEISSWKDSDHIYWSIGDLTIDGVSWPQTVVRYTESSTLWTAYATANEVRWGADFNDGSTLRRVIGLDNGVVANAISGTTDLGEPIKYRAITKWYEFEGIELQKIIQRLIAVCEKAQGSELMYQVDDDPAYRSLGQLRKFITDFDRLNIKFHRIRFKITGVSSVEAFVFLGLEIPMIISEGIII